MLSDEICFSFFFTPTLTFPNRSSLLIFLSSNGKGAMLINTQTRTPTEDLSNCLSTHYVINKQDLKKEASAPAEMRLIIKLLPVVNVVSLKSYNN